MGERIWRRIVPQKSLRILVLLVRRTLSARWASSPAATRASVVSRACRTGLRRGSRVRHSWASGPWAAGSFPSVFQSGQLGAGRVEAISLSAAHALNIIRWARDARRTAPMPLLILHGCATTTGSVGIEQSPARQSCRSGGRIRMRMTPSDRQGSTTRPGQRFSKRRRGETRPSGHGYGAYFPAFLAAASIQDPMFSRPLSLAQS